MTLSKLANAELFQGLSEDELKHIFETAQQQNIASGHTLIEESEVSQSIYLILQGRVDIRVELPGSDESEVIATLKEGEVVGEIALLARTRRTAKVTARDDIEVLVWDKTQLSELFSSNAGLGYKVMTNLACLLADRLSATNIALRNVLTAPRTIFL